MKGPSEDFIWGYHKEIDVAASTLRNALQDTDRARKGILDTCSGTYLLNATAKREYVNHRFTERFHPDYKDEMLSMVNSGDFIKGRSFDSAAARHHDWNARPVEQAYLEEQGLSFQGDRHPTLQNSMGWVVDKNCAPDHYIILGYSIASRHWNIRVRTLQRYVSQGMPHFYAGKHIVFNVTSGTQWLVEHGKM